MERKKIVILLVLLLCVATVAAAVTYTFVTPKLPVYPQPSALTCSMSWDRQYLYVGDTAVLNATVTNPNSNLKFKVDSLTIINTGTANVKIWYGNTNNYITLNNGQSITISTGDLGFEYVEPGDRGPFYANVVALSAGNIELTGTFQGSWMPVS